MQSSPLYHLTYTNKKAASGLHESSLRLLDYAYALTVVGQTVLCLFGGSCGLYLGLVLLHLAVGKVDDVLAVGNDAIVLLLRTYHEFLPLLQTRTGRG